MKILVDNSDYRLCNAGDIAMLQVALSRLREMWPDCQLLVLTTDPDRLAHYCPSASPISPSGRDELVRPGGVLGWSRRKLHPLEKVLLHKAPSVADAIIRLRSWKTGEDRGAGRNFLNNLCSADLVVATGGGYVNDIFSYHAGVMLTMMRVAHARRKPTALLGHGLGPLTDRSLGRLAAPILGKMKLISLREGVESLPVLKRLGVDTSRAIVTGDDGVELAIGYRCEELGSDLGFNVRIADYAGTGQLRGDSIRAAMAEMSRRLGATITAVPIAAGPDTSDQQSVNDLLASVEGFTPIPVDRSALIDPAGVIQKILRCRVVVTGSYHAAVFALALGIPVAGLSQSPYYNVKFRGLMDLFGPACRVVDIANDFTPGVLTACIEELWECAPSFRPGLWQAADRQAERGREAYLRLYRMLQGTDKPDRAASAGQ